jgi:hypothetical protein
LFDRPQNQRELFNYQHSQLWNHIEHIFGLFKRRFRILLLAPEYSLRIQAQLIPALTVLHNFIRIHDPSDLPDEEDDVQDYASNEIGLQDNTDAKDTAAGFWEGIALRMWQDYQETRNRPA